MGIENKPMIRINNTLDDVISSVFMLISSFHFVLDALNIKCAALISRNDDSGQKCK